MRTFSASYIFTNTGNPLKNGVVTTADDGTIISVKDNENELTDRHSVESHNGIIIPGFVNCHCHLELSHLKGAIPPESGLGEFLLQLQNIRKKDPDEILSAARSADREMYKAGIVLCADICNNPGTFSIKKNSPVKYFNFLETFAMNPAMAEASIASISKLAEESEQSGIPFSIVPHTVYSVSRRLFSLLKEKTAANRVTSIHFMETESEELFLTDHSGPLAEAFKKAGMLPAETDTPDNPVSAILNDVTPSGSLILVHNTFAGRETVRKINKRGNTFWCLCPNANLYIEGCIPPAEMLQEEGCNIVTGTDSLASNSRLSILSELITLQKYYPSLSLEKLIRWATLNGAKALGEDQRYGSIISGKKPGLLLLQNTDLRNLILTPETAVSRLI